MIPKSFNPTDPALKGLWDTFTRELQVVYDLLHGPENIARYLKASTMTLSWLRNDGHGKVVLPAIGHRIGEHVTIETVRKVRPSMTLETVLADVQRLGHGTLTVQVRGTQNVLETIIISDIREI